MKFENLEDVLQYLLFFDDELSKDDLEDALENEELYTDEEDYNFYYDDLDECFILESAN